MPLLLDNGIYLYDGLTFIAGVTGRIVKVKIIYVRNRKKSYVILWLPIKLKVKLLLNIVLILINLFIILLETL